MTDIRPMLADKGTERDLDDPTKAAELKADGTRSWLMGKDEHQSIRGRPRESGSSEYVRRLPEIAEAMKAIPAGEFIIDAEIVVYDADGRTWFTPCQRRCSTENPAKQKKLRAKYPAVALAFDIIELDGKDLSEYPWETRKEILETLLNETVQESIRFMPHTVEDKREAYEEAVERGEEGLILKDLRSPYLFGKRSKSWLKVKHWDKARCKVMGYTPGTGKFSDMFGALILARADDRGYLEYCGKVGTGFSRAERKHITGLLEEHEADEKRVHPRDSNDKRIPYTPVDIDLEVTVKFYETSKNGVFRMPSMLKDKQGNNMIHYNSDTIKGTAKQSSLKELLGSITE